MKEGLGEGAWPQMEPENLVRYARVIRPRPRLMARGCTIPLTRPSLSIPVAGTDAVAAKQTASQTSAANAALRCFETLPRHSRRGCLLCDGGLPPMVPVEDAPFLSQEIVGYIDEPSLLNAEPSAEAHG